MNRDDVIRMAQDCWPSDRRMWSVDADLPRLERFAALVASAEREKVARWHIGSGYTTGHGDTIEDLLVELEWQVRESEREACAKVAEKESLRGLPEEQPEGEELLRACAQIAGGVLIADAIRARGQA